MSFDTDLDYSPVIDGFNQRITDLQNQIAENTTTVQLLEDSPYANLISSEITRLHDKIDENQTIINNYQHILSEIERINTLSIEEKTLLHYFYTVLGISKKIYMSKMLFNTDALNNTDVLTIYNDQITPVEVKIMVAKLVYEKFVQSNLYPEIRYVKMYL